MDIKSIVSSQRVRHFLMKSFFWLPDRWMLAVQYWLISRRWPDLKSPKRFTEKVQWYKMNYRNPLMLQCVDKFAVRKYVEEKMGDGGILNDLYQVCDSAEEIDFPSLPEQFVVKTTDGGNGDNVLIVKDKSSLNIPEAVRRIDLWRNKKYYVVSREWAYKGLRPRIIAEKYLEGEIRDYKFFCFDGEPRLMFVASDRFVPGEETKYDFFDMDWNRLDIRNGHPNASEPPAEPGCFGEMKRLAAELSRGIPQVRVDFYEAEGKVLFGEYTFYHWGGFMPFDPDAADLMIGSMFKIPKKWTSA